MAGPGEPAPQAADAVSAGRTGVRGRRIFLPGGMLASFGTPGYAALWVSGAVWAFGTTVTVVAIGWVTLQVTDSALAVGLVFAARLLPALLLGIPLGGLVDRFDRLRTLIAVDIGYVVPLVAIGVLAGAGQPSLVALLVLSILLGVADTLGGTATQSYAVDLAGPAAATNALALRNLGAFGAGVVGSIAGGAVLDAVGAGGAFVLAAALAGVAALILILGGRGVRHEPTAATEHPSFGRTMTLILRNRAVAVIAAIVIVAEIFGFSCATLFPTFARDVLFSDAAGLGALSAARYLGSIAALLLLARTVIGTRGGRLVLLATLGLGLSLVGFALSRSFGLSLAMLFGVGVASAGLDTLVQAMLQRSVDDRERGAAVGIWYFAIGFGPIGQLGLGAAAAAIGAPLALAISGGILSLFAVGLAGSRTVRRL